MTAFSWTYSVTTHPKWRTELKFLLQEAECDELASAIQRLLNGEREVAMRLPFQKEESEGVFDGSWLLFWKIRGEGSRAMLAHPEVDQWVATLALEKEGFSSVLEKLKESKSFGLEDVVSLGLPSNFHIRFERNLSN